MIAALDATRAEFQYEWFGGVEVVDHDVDVELLRPRRVRPLRRDVVRSKLEGEPRCHVVIEDDDPVIRTIGDRQAEQFRVERCQSVRVGAVDDDVVAAPITSPIVADAATRSN